MLTSPAIGTSCRQVGRSRHHGRCCCVHFHRLVWVLGNVDLEITGVEVRERTPESARRSTCQQVTHGS